ncbi:MAG TPA: hypothetical protein PK694_10690, partial [Rhodospirillales bacterium]|nr:hypothetical protein [Rhodospirillales bacterium]
MAVKTLSSWTLTVRPWKVSASLSPATASLKAARALLNLPRADSSSLALPSRLVSRLAVGARSAATSCSTIELMSRPEPSPVDVSVAMVRGGPFQGLGSGSCPDRSKMRAIRSGRSGQVG